MNGGNATFPNKTLRSALNFYVVTIKRNRARICQERSPRPAGKGERERGAPGLLRPRAPAARPRAADLDPGSRGGELPSPQLPGRRAELTGRPVNSEGA